VDDLDEMVELAHDIHTNYLRDLALSVVLLNDEGANKSLFDYIQFVGDFELLGEITRLTMNSDYKSEYSNE
jgi:hypothetical protein|tara:strand:+ start:33 stop:245 length:213 start_codon:yes stop_codon:yes gene_type:complete